MIDVLIAGGGVNGVGIARDAAGRGLSVMVCEKADLAQATSSASSKLIHGGLRYLEYGAFGLVRKALAERERLTRAAPHLVRPLRFVLPHERGLRPQWMLRAGLTMYDLFAGKSAYPRARRVNLEGDGFGAELKPHLRGGFIYSDAQVDDARLVVINAVDAAERGGVVRTRTEVASVRRSGDHWAVELRTPGGGAETITARLLVDATGPWAGALQEAAGGDRRALRLVKGSHIVTRRLYEGDHAFTFQHPDGRIVFAIPYQNEFTLIGTTEEPFSGEPDAATISEEERDYLCAAIRDRFARPIQASDIIWTFSGVRPLIDDGRAKASSVSRDYAFQLDAPDGAAPLLTVQGGKLTTYRQLAEAAVDRIARVLNASKAAWTHAAVLPGGDIPGGDMAAFDYAASERWPWLDAAVRRRWADAYGTRIERIVGAADTMSGLGEEVATDLFEAELDYLKNTEWARSAEDVLWRRTKLGLWAGDGDAAAVESWLRR